MIQATIVPVTPFQQNCSILWCDKTKKAAVVDPGGDIDRILAAVAKLGVTVERILITHGHIDHAGGTAKLARALGVPVIATPAGDLERWAKRDEGVRIARGKADLAPLLREVLERRP